MRLMPGTVILEKNICQYLGISRTPLREALLELASERLIMVKPGGGTFVTKILLSDVLQGQLIRDTMEMRLLRLAARTYTAQFESDFELALFKQRSAAKRKNAEEFFSLDNEFHQLICRCSGFPEAWRVIHNATGQLDRVRRFAFPLQENYDEVLKEHESIYNFIRMNDVENAAAVFQVQLDATFPTLEIISSNHPELIEGSASIDDIR
ncbi:FCD domain-containing protein [Enterobacteriales bacterium SAP-6]|uniref:FCD domain-containing protein n=2 Tax=Acerihabitans arboris TaxID=2691583 RepID=A0A845SP58_9GAMM|nr:FCD domain-containing protein [Acerihabitans arboris]